MPIDNVEGSDYAYYPNLVNIYGCKIGEGTRVGPFVEIQSGVVIGKNCKISSHSFICTGVDIGDGVFVGHGVMFINDRNPHATDGVKLATTWHLEETHVGDYASIGTNVTVMCGVNIGDHSIVGAGSVVLKDVEPYTVVAGNPARVIRRLK